MQISPQVFFSNPPATQLNLLPRNRLTYTTPHQLRFRIENPRQPTRHLNRQIPTPIHCIPRTATNLNHHLTSRKPRNTSRQIQRITPSSGSKIGKHADDLVSREALSHHDGRAVGVDRVCFVGYVGAVFVDCLVADLV